MMKKLALAMLFAVCVSAIFAQDTSGYNFSVDHIAISVKDVNRAADFYMKILKLPEITNRSKIEGVRWFILGDKRELHLISVIKENVTINKAVHLGLSSSRFDEFVKVLVANKIPYSDWPGKPDAINIRADGIKQVFFQDPDGYWIEINSLKK